MRRYTRDVQEHLDNNGLREIRATRVEFLIGWTRKATTMVVRSNVGTCFSLCKIRGDGHACLPRWFNSRLDHVWITRSIALSSPSTRYCSLFPLSLRTYQLCRLHPIIDRQVHRQIGCRFGEKLRHFAHVLDICDTQALRTAASLHRIRRHSQLAHPDPVDIRLIDSLSRHRRKFRAAFIDDERRTVYSARSAFFRRVHVQPIGGDAPARFEDEVRPFTFNEHREALIVGARKRDPGDEISREAKPTAIALILYERELRGRVSRRVRVTIFESGKMNVADDTRCNLRPMIRVIIFQQLMPIIFCKNLLGISSCRRKS